MREKQKGRLPHILMIYVEPTPYIVQLIDLLAKEWSGHTDVFFLFENKSQYWDLALDRQGQVLPNSISGRLKLMIKLFQQKKYDAIHIAGWGHPILILFIILAKMYRVPISIESDTPIPYDSPQWKRMIKRCFYPLLFSGIQVFLPGGTRQANYFKHYGVKSERIHIAKMTVDILSMQRDASALTPLDRKQIRQAFSIEEEDVVFLFVGRLVEPKGILDLIKTFFSFQDEKSKLLIVGDGPLKDHVEESVKINSKIRYAGRLKDKQLIEAYFISDVLVLPSHFEPWGLVVNEAMALGKPVIISDRVGCADDLVTQKTGRVVKATSMEELQKALEYMIARASERLSMGEESLKKISNWTLENEAKIICQAWYQLI